jgi:hypothetical protein
MSMEAREEWLSSLIGSWKLAAFAFEFEDGERVPVYVDGCGSLIITAERFAAILCDKARKVSDPVPSLFEGMMAYSGRYQLQGDDTVVVGVDVAWHPSWLGTKQTRHFKMTDQTLAIISSLQEHPKYPGRMGRGVINWTRE